MRWVPSIEKANSTRKAPLWKANPCSAIGRVASQLEAPFSVKTCSAPFMSLVSFSSISAAAAKSRSFRCLIASFFAVNCAGGSLKALREWWPFFLLFYVLHKILSSSVSNKKNNKKTYDISPHSCYCYCHVKLNEHAHLMSETVLTSDVFFAQVPRSGGSMTHQE